MSAIENNTLPARNAPTAQRPEQAPNGADLKNQFMTLLVAQIKNQSPDNPMDSSALVGQLAQFSQVESSENMAKMMASNNALMEKMQMITTANLVGQQVMVASNQVELGTQSQSGRLTLQHAASDVALYLTDAQGQEHRIDLGEHAAGRVDFTLDPTQQNLKPGSYQLSAVSSSGEELIPLELAGTVNSVRIPERGGVAQLAVAGIGEVPYGQIKQFGM